MTANIREIFFSLQGEGLYMGLPFVFIRFNRCNLDCAYCDTPAALSDSPFCRIFPPHSGQYFTIENPIDIEELRQQLQTFPSHFITFTGGEPLLHSEFITEALPLWQGKFLLMETNGTITDSVSPALINRIDSWSVDIKLPSVAGSEYWTAHKIFLNRMVDAREVTVKCVFHPDTPSEELKQAAELVLELYSQNPHTSLIFQTLTRPQGIELGQAGHCIVSMMNDYPFKIRILPQIHPILKVP